MPAKFRVSLTRAAESDEQAWILSRSMVPKQQINLLVD